MKIVAVGFLIVNFVQGNGLMASPLNQLQAGKIDVMNASVGMVPGGTTSRVRSERDGTVMQPGDFLSVGQTVASLDSAGFDAAPAINAALAAGNAVYLPKGTYSIQSPIVMPSGSRIYGSGPSTLLRIDGASTIGLSVSGMSDVDIADLSIAPGVDREADDVQLYHSTRVFLTNVRWLQTAFQSYTSLHIMGASDTHVINATMISSGTRGYGILVDGDSYASSRTHLTNIYTWGYLDGLKVNWSSGLFLDGGNYTHAYGAGISVAPDTAHRIYAVVASETVDNLRAHEVRAYSNLGHGWEFAGDGSITEVALTNSGGSQNGVSSGDQSYIGNGMYVSNPSLDGLSVTGSDFHSNMGNGLLFEQGRHITVTGNTIFNNSAYEKNGSNGITITAAASYISLMGNMIGSGGVTSTAANQGWGVYATSSDHLLAVGNALSGNNLGGLYSLTDGTNTNANNTTD